jgi:RNA polymerase sigma factor (sigma-70 family)
MYNPFSEKTEEHENDSQLIRKIMCGSRRDVEKLILRHQAWIYNISLKMVMDSKDAEDITQEILIKMLTKLSTYNPLKASFRTWLYRIVANHVINMKKKKYELIFTSFDQNASMQKKIPDQISDSSPEFKILTEELKIKCWTALLLCLNRRHRLVFILSEIFNVKDAFGSEIVNISKVNYRNMLSRSRKKLSNYINSQCGLINEENPCNCSRKLNGFIKKEFINPDHVWFYQDKVKKIKDVVYDKMEKLENFKKLSSMARYREHPFYESPDFEKWLSNTISNADFREIIRLDLH